MFEKLYIAYGQMFDKLNEQGKDGYLIIKGTVPCRLLNELYNKFTKKDGITPIGELPEEKKRKYWDISKRYYIDTAQRMRATKAAYTLALITSTD